MPRPAPGGAGINTNGACIERRVFGMKITDVQVFAVGMDLDEPLRWGAMVVRKRGAVMVQIATDEGITGIGEAGATLRSRRIRTVVEEDLKPVLLGQNPFDIGALWRRMFQAIGQWRMRRIETDALSGVDIALWDLLGKAMNKPVFRLLGACRTRMPAYWAPCLKPADVIARECEQAVAQGFKAIKLRAGLGTDEDLRIVQKVRRVVGDKVVLMLDPNMSYDLPTAVEMARRFQEYQLFWIEEPLRTHSIPQYLDLHSRLSELVDVRIAGGETLFSHYEFASVFTRRTFGIVQPDAAMVGGISETLKVANMASGWEIPCVPHVYAGSVAGIGMAANLHVICAIDNALYLEYDAYDSPIREELFVEPIKAVDGFVDIPERPGLGLELNPDAVARYRID
jgi:L-alanine-DL-glutamate epimerase-like enolase superfamily enzyme